MESSQPMSDASGSYSSAQLDVSGGVRLQNAAHGFQGARPRTTSAKTGSSSKKAAKKEEKKKKSKKRRSPTNPISDDSGEFTTAKNSPTEVHVHSVSVAEIRSESSALLPTEVPRVESETEPAAGASAAAAAAERTVRDGNANSCDDVVVVTSSRSKDVKGKPPEQV